MSDKNKDDIISAQLEVIKSMTENNLRRVGDDLWSIGVSKSDAEHISRSENTESAGEKPEAAEEKPHENKESDDSPKENIDDLLAELDSYIGLEKVKEEVRTLINLAKVYALRRDAGLPVTDMSLHMVFSGNPGTGKTMMARFMSRVYHSLGLLAKGHLVECDRAGLVAGYVGQTAIKTEKKCTEALGGVLFIDEAYTLVSKGGNDFGAEAVDTLLKFMEDRRGEIVVIVAGYTELMKSFISSNPGLESRFNKYLDFQDYTPPEMVQIFKLNCKKGFYVLTEEAEKSLLSCLEEKAKKADFGNARGVRNFFEKVLSAQANRISALETVTKETLSEITEKDIKTAFSA